jgi:subfamily B ATP-binding cassette protein MsbA
VERGTHDELYAAQGRYHELYTKQHGVESNLFLAPGEGDIVEEPSGDKKPAGAGAIAEAMRLLRG